MRRLEDWTKQLAQTTDDFEREFRSLTKEEMNWKPDEKTWSIAQNIDHLIVINESYFPIFNSIQKGTYKTPFLGKFGFLAQLFGNMLLKSVQPDRKRKVKTFPMWKPEEERELTNILEKFKEHQANLKLQLQHLESFLGGKTIIASPANKNIVYRLDTAFDIIATHEQRHFNQAKEVKNRGRFGIYPET